MKPSPSASSQATSILSMIRWPRIARTFLPELKELFVQVLLLAQETGVLKLGTISLDGTKMHADASRHNAVSYKRLRELETQLRAEIEELFILSEQSDQREIPDGLVVREEMARREDRLARLAQATLVLETRATERAAAEQAEYEAKLAQRAERERTTGRRTGGRPPTPPVPGPREGDQFNFTETPVAQYEKPDRCGLRAGLQRAGSRGSEASAHRGMCALHITPTILRKPSLRSRPSRPRSARQRRRLSRLAILVPRRSPRVRNAVSSPLSPQVVIPIMPVGSSALRRCPIRRSRTRVPRSRWPTSGIDSSGQNDLWRTYMHRRTGDWHHQGGARLPPVLLTWRAGCCG